MNVDDGYMRRLTIAELAQSREDLIERLRQQNEIEVPEKHEEAVVNMNRQQRRAWARRQRKAQEAAGLANTAKETR